MVWALLWIGWALAFFAIELPAVFNKTHDDTLSERLRALFHTNTKVGRSVWVICWGVFSALFLAHILGSGSIFW